VCFVVLKETAVSSPTPQSPSQSRISLASGKIEDFDIIMFAFSEPEMADLITIVIPRIEAYWEDVAFILRYNIPKVMAIKESHGGNATKCCRELFVNWLSTDYGVSPKTWSTLLKKLKEIDWLKRATEEIMEDLNNAT